MKALLLFVFFFATTMVHAAVDDLRLTAFLEAIRLEESGNNDNVVGRHGERGAYQFKAKTWRDRTKEPFSLAHDRTTASAVAVRHYEWLKRALVTEGLDEPSEWAIAAAWNAGARAVAKGQLSMRSYTYARRVMQTTEELYRDAIAAQSETPAPMFVLETNGRSRAGFPLQIATL
jgi:hypothetical protein